MGLTGLTGPQGLKGNTGSTGATGPTGPQGNQGTQGPKGDQGDQGPAGADGSNGLFASGAFYVRASALSHTSLSTTYSYGIQATCDAGDIMVTGGCRSKMWYQSGGLWYVRDANFNEDPATLLDSYPETDTSDPVQWECRYWPNDPDAHLGAYVWCLNVP